MEVKATDLEEVLIITPAIFADSRGSIFQSWNAERYAALSIPAFVQDNISRTAKGIVRGLHLQHPSGQGKLVSVLEGEVVDVAVDVRPGSPTFRRFVTAALTSLNHRQLYVPPGFAHGFQVLSDSALVMYKCSSYHRPDAEIGIRWDDPEIGIGWPLQEATVSEKDARAPFLRDIPAERLPSFD